MKALVALGLASVIAIAAASPANALGGCGRGYHRGPRGYCRPNMAGPVVAVGPEVYVVGRYYPGRGYWYDNRWYQRRYRYHRGWRYN